MKSLKVIFLSNLDKELKNKTSLGTLHELVPFNEDLYRLKHISKNEIKDLELTCFVLSQESKVIEVLYPSKIDVLEQPHIGLYKKRTKENINVKTFKNK